MNRKRNLGIVGAVLAVTGGILLAWGKSVYDHTEAVQDYYYALTGNSVAMSSMLAAKDAAEAANAMMVGGWVALAAALFALVMAIASR